MARKPKRKAKARKIARKRPASAKRKTTRRKLARKKAATRKTAQRKRSPAKAPRKKAPKRHKLDHTPFLVLPGKPFNLTRFDTAYTAGLADKKGGKSALKEDIKDLAAAQELLWANGSESVLIILQAMDAAGKDGTIKHVMSGINPQGVNVHSFKAPNDEERKHHFLWRASVKMPAKGRIGIFNRSYYEEVLVVRVHPGFLDKQFLPERIRSQPLTKIWKARYADINRYEEIAAANDTLILKFFLNVSKEEQRKRLLARLNEPDKNWKFNPHDIKERQLWDRYMEAYEEMLNATSTPHAPWYVIPADHKWFARAAIADIIAARIRGLDLQPPQATEEQLAGLAEARRQLRSEAP